MQMKKRLKGDWNKIIVLYYTRDIFAGILTGMTLCAALISYVLKDRDEFWCSFFLNIAGGLLTGLIVTIWFRLSDNYKEKLKCDKSKLLEQIWLRKLEEFHIEEWDEEYSSGFYDELAYYAGKFEEFKSWSAKCKIKLNGSKEYFFHMQDILKKGEKIIEKISEAENVLGQYEIEEYLFSDPNSTDDIEITLLPPVPMLSKNNELEEDRDKYIIIKERIDSVGEEVVKYNELLNEISEGLEKKMDRI